MMWLIRVAIMLFMGLSATQAACSISGTSVNFGTYTGAAVNGGTGSVTVNCSFGVSYTVGINSGLHQGGGNYNWNMLGPSASSLHYEMFRDAGRSQFWGNTQYLDTINKVGNGGPQTINFWPGIPASTLSIPGVYTDTITVFVYSIFGTTSAQITVTATMPASCTISATSLNFGIYTVTQLNATSVLTVKCTNTTPYYVNLDNGLQSSCCWYNNMKSAAGAQLSYVLYQDAAHTRPWQNTVNLDGEAGTGTGANQSLTVFGQVSAGQNVAPGSYADTVVARVTY